MRKFYRKYFFKGLEEIALARALKMDKLELKYMIICGLASMGHGFLNATYNFLLADALEVRCWSLVPGPFWWWPLVSGPQPFAGDWRGYPLVLSRTSLVRFCPKSCLGDWEVEGPGSTPRQERGTTLPLDRTGAPSPISPDRIGGIPRQDRDIPLKGQTTLRRHSSCGHAGLSCTHVSYVYKRYGCLSGP